jgi:hypothetical protein
MEENELANEKKILLVIQRDNYDDGGATLTFYEDGTYVTPSMVRREEYSYWLIVDGVATWNHHTSGKPGSPFESVDPHELARLLEAEMALNMMLDA